MIIQKNSYLWKFPLTTKTYMSYAARYYTGFACWDEFLKDLNTFRNISKQLMQRKNNGAEFPIQKILNNFVLLGNVFQGDALARLGFFLSNPNCWIEVKTFLFVIYRLPRQIPEAPIGKLSINPKLLEWFKRI